MKRVYVKSVCLFLLLLAGCARKTELTVYNQAVDKKYLASTKVKTPDPRQHPVDRGQRLIIAWSAPGANFKKDCWSLKAYLQYGNRKEEVKEIAVQRRFGEWTLEWVGDEFYHKRGVVSYKVDLLKNGVVEKTFCHQLYCEIIRLEPI
jgi:hypothetical protein